MNDRKGENKHKKFITSPYLVHIANYNILVVYAPFKHQNMYNIFVFVT